MWHRLLISCYWLDVPSTRALTGRMISKALFTTSPPDGKSYVITTARVPLSISDNFWFLLDDIEALLASNDR